jgi:hypothetical protein
MVKLITAYLKDYLIFSYSNNYLHTQMAKSLIGKFLFTFGNEEKTKAEERSIKKMAV